MRRIEFSIEDNGPKLEIGKEYAIIEYQSANYFYMIEDALGMSPPVPLSEGLKSRKGIVVEKKKTARQNVAVLEFDE